MTARQETLLRGRCPHCHAAGALYSEEIAGELDAVCAICGFRRTGIVRRKGRKGRDSSAGAQQLLPLAAP